MVCTKEGGLKAQAFVAPYLGELYCSWAWAERQVWPHPYLLHPENLRVRQQPPKNRRPDEWQCTTTNDCVSFKAFHFQFSEGNSNF